MSIEQNIEQIKNNIKSHKTAKKVTFVAVTKTVDTEKILDLYHLGIRDFGENRVNMLLQKAEDLKEYTDINWHFIGHLQRNKVKKIIPIVKYIHSVDSLRLAETINAQCKTLNKKTKILLELNVSGEESKDGFTKKETLDNLDMLSKYNNIELVGFMTMAPFSASSDELRKIFKSLREFAILINSQKESIIKFMDLSMGMSQDYIEALKEGSTMIRIGSKIFH
jgi:PLP dependent protein